MPVAGQFRDFPLADAVNAVRHATGTLRLFSLPGVGQVELDLHEGVIIACRAGIMGEEVAGRADAIAEKLLIAHGAPGGEWSFHPAAAPARPRCHVPLDAAMLEMLSRADEITAAAGTFRPPSFRLRWKGGGKTGLPEDLQDFITRARPTLSGAFGTRASALAEELGLAVGRTQHFLARLEEAGWVEPSVVTSEQDAAKPAVRFQAGPAHVKWFYREGNEEIGPVGEEVIIQRIAQGLQLPQEPVWCQGLARWSPYEEIKARDAVQPRQPTGLVPAPGGGGPALATCALCNGTFPPVQLREVGGEWLCAACREQLFPGSVPEGERVLASLAETAPRGRRLVAWMLDTALFLFSAENIRILLAEQGAPGADDPWTLLSMVLLVYVVWHTAFVALAGATPGKWALGLRVVRRADPRYGPGFLGALGRAIGSLVPFGFAPLLLSSERSTLHDRLAATRVVLDR